MLRQTLTIALVVASLVIVHEPGRAQDEGTKRFRPEEHFPEGDETSL